MIIGDDKPPSRLWRVYSLRKCNGQEIRHIRWFINEQEAYKHGKWINDGRGVVLNIAEYLLRNPV